MSRLYVFLTLCFLSGTVFAQKQFWKADSWEQVKANKGGTITALWYDIEPFIYIGKDGKLEGVEYEIMEGFKRFVNQQYGYQLTVSWENAGSFDNIYSAIKEAKLPGLTGWSYFSITDDRKKEIKFTPPYMTDLNVLVTNNAQPFFTNPQEFTSQLGDLQAFTMQHTTMEEDVLALKNNFYSKLKIDDKADDYNVMLEIAENKKGFGYVPLSVYIVGLQKGIKIKRQNVLTNKREGFAGIMPMSSDWQPVWEEYFNKGEVRKELIKIISKYMGSQVGDLVITASKADSSQLYSSNMELLSLEKEIVTQKLIDTAVESQRQKTLRNILIGLGIIFLLISGILYNRFKVKQKLTKSLQQRNHLIAAQKDQIEKMNQQLEIKILQSKLNPHFLFNSLNSIQYFINENDRKGAMQYIQRFSKFLRQVLHSSDELTIPVQQELVLIDQYLWLEQNRFPGRFNYEVLMDDSVRNSNSMIPPLLTHPVVEEALYLSVLNDDKDKEHFIRIEFSKQENRLQVAVKDNGMPKEFATAQQKARGLLPLEENGLQQRLELINNNNPAKVVVQYDLGNNGAAYTNQTILSIPQT